MSLCLCLPPRCITPTRAGKFSVLVLWAVSLCLLSLSQVYYPNQGCEFSVLVLWCEQCPCVSPPGVLPQPGLDVCGCHWPREGELAALHKLGPLGEGAEPLSSGDQQDHLLQEFKGITVWTAATLLSFSINTFYSALLKNFFLTLYIKQILKHFMEHLKHCKCYTSLV